MHSLASLNYCKLIFRNWTFFLINVFGLQLILLNYFAILDRFFYKANCLISESNISFGWQSFINFKRERCKFINNGFDL